MRPGHTATLQGICSELRVDYQLLVRRALARLRWTPSPLLFHVKPSLAAIHRVGPINRKIHALSNGFPRHTSADSAVPRETFAGCPRSRGIIREVCGDVSLKEQGPASGMADVRLSGKQLRVLPELRMRRIKGTVNHGQTLLVNAGIKNVATRQRWLARG